MNLTQLRYFLAIGRTQSLSRAAEQLHVSQPALTRQIKLLEHELDCDLLERHPRGVRLTDSGRAFLERAEHQLRMFEQLRSDFADAAFAPNGRLRIGCPPSLSSFLMPRPFTQFIRAHPKVILEVQESVSDELARDILEDRLDVAIASITQRGLGPHLLGEPLFKEPVWLFGPRGARLTHIDVQRVPMILTRLNNAARGVAEQDLQKLGVQLNVVAETDSPRLMVDMIKSGAGYTLAPCLTFLQELRSRQMSGAPFKGLTIERYFIRRKDRPVNKAILAFKALLAPELQRAVREIRSINKLPPGRVGSIGSSLEHRSRRAKENAGRG